MIARLSQLTGREVKWLAIATAALPVASVLLRTRGLIRTLAFSERPLTEPAHAAGSEAGAMARCVRLAATYGPYRARCLPRAVVLHWLLRRRGLNAVVRIGVRKPGDRLDAHAWVEVDGRPFDVDATAGDQFVPLRNSGAGRA